MKQDPVINPFLPEGKFFWGDDPPFNPSAAPCGTLFQKYNGLRGHYLDATDYDREHERLLRERIQEACINKPVLLNKNPYNTVRVQWVKTIFPESIVVAITRNPVSTVFSLQKKILDYTVRSAEKTEGVWWGIKPKNWFALVHKDKIIQLSQQWSAVNNELIKNTHLIDYMLEYSNLCRSPLSHLQKIAEITGFQLTHHIKKVKSFDNEYKTGSRLLSKNKETRKLENFDLSELDEPLEVPPFTEAEQETINRLTSATWNQLQSRL